MNLTVHQVSAYGQAVFRGNEPSYVERIPSGYASGTVRLSVRGRAVPEAMQIWQDEGRTGGGRERGRTCAVPATRRAGGGGRSPRPGYLAGFLPVTPRWTSSARFGLSSACLTPQLVKPF